MKYRFNSIAIICRRNNPNSINALFLLINYLKKKHIQIFIEKQTSSFLPLSHDLKIVTARQMNTLCDLIAAVGGDGSFLSAARLAAQNNLPLIGINRGELGFLADITLKSMHEIENIIRGNFYEEKRLFLKTTILESGKTAKHSLAINDVVFLSQTPGRLIEFIVHLNGNFLCSYRSDGLIVATPTGSTAHALSSGGPILYPTLENIVLVPMLSHNLSSRPIVISDEQNIEITFTTKANRANLMVICDGHLPTKIHSGTVHISKAKDKLMLLHPENYNFFSILRSKLHWEQNT